MARGGLAVPVVVAAAVAVAFAVGGCAGSASAPAISPTTTPLASVVPAAPTASPTVGAQASVDPATVTIVQGWLDAQNAGELETAASFFATGARIGDKGAVTTHSVQEVVAALQPVAICHHEIVSSRQEGSATLFAVNISGAGCPFLAAGEATHEIEIPVQIRDGKIICTCRDGA